MRRYELSLDQYKAIEDLLQMNGKVGGQWKDHRSRLNDMFWVLYSGAQWREMPERYGSPGKQFIPASVDGAETVR